MERGRLTFDLIDESEHTHTELDTIYEEKVFDVSYEIGGYQFYFRCTQVYNSGDLENTVEFLEDESDYCDEKAVDFMKDKITNLYL